MCLGAPNPYNCQSFLAREKAPLNDAFSAPVARSDLISDNLLMESRVLSLRAASHSAPKPQLTQDDEKGGLNSPESFFFQKPGNHPNFEKKRSRSEKAILGANLGIPGYSRNNSRNGTHDLICVKTLFSEQLSEQLSELVGRQNFSPNSRCFFFKIGVAPAR